MVYCKKKFKIMLKKGGIIMKLIDILSIEYLKTCKYNKLCYVDFSYNFAPYRELLL